MDFTRLGDKLKAFRIDRNLTAEEVSAKLDVSRAALYRYEKGEVIKMDTVSKIAGLLDVSAASLLDLGVDYVSAPLEFFKRIAAEESSAEQIVFFNQFPCYLTTSTAYDRFIRHALGRVSVQADALCATNEQRKDVYRQRRPSVISIVSMAALRQFIQGGVAPGVAMSQDMRGEAIELALKEAEHFAQTMESEPIGLQFGFVDEAILSTSFTMIRNKATTCVAVNPFPVDDLPMTSSGLTVVSTDEAAASLHESVVGDIWRIALKGASGAAALRKALRMPVPA